MTYTTRYLDHNDITIGRKFTTTESLETAIREAQTGAETLVDDLPEEERNGSILWEITDETGTPVHHGEMSAE